MINFFYCIIICLFHIVFNFTIFERNAKIALDIPSRENRVDVNTGIEII